MATSEPVSMTPDAALARHLECLEYALAAARDEETRRTARLDKATGKTVWKTDRQIDYGTDNGDYKKAYATPALFDIKGRPELVCPSATCTIAYDPKTGAELWRIRHGGMNGSARPVMARVVMTSGNWNRVFWTIKSRRLASSRLMDGARRIVTTASPSSMRGTKFAPFSLNT